MTSKGESGQNQVRFVVWWYRLILVGTFSFFAVLLLSLLLSATSNPAAVAFVAVAMGMMTMVVLRALRSASVELNEHEVVIRGLLRTRRIGWTEVRTVEVGRGSSAALLPWRVPCFELDDGSVVRADDVRSLRDNTIVHDVVEESRRRIRR